MLREEPFHSLLHYKKSVLVYVEKELTVLSHMASMIGLYWEQRRRITSKLWKEAKCFTALLYAK